MLQLLEVELENRIRRIRFSHRIFFIAAMLLFAGCEDKKQVAKVPAPLVSGYTVIQKDVPLDIEAPAKITGSREIQVRAQVSGILKSRTYQEGQYVVEGEKLFEIDPEPYKATLTKAQGSLAQAESEVRRTGRDYERMKKLYNAKAISQKEHDDSLSAYERAEANLKVAEGAVREAEINLGYTEIKAPISGIVRKEAQSVGNLISAAGDSSLLTSMVKTCPLHANFSVPGRLWSRLAKEYDAGKVSMSDYSNCKVEVYMSDGTKYKKDGRIIFVDSSEDHLTSSVSIKAEIPNDKDQRVLLPGQFVRVKIVGAKYKDATVVPASALVSTKSGYMVYVVDKNNTVEIRPVQATIIDNEAVVDSGLSVGEVIISEGVAKARAGQEVKVVMKDAEKSTKE